MSRDAVPALLVAAALGGYALFGLAWVSLPGPYHDEVIFLNASFPLSPVTYYVAKVQIFHWDIPTMLMPYLGALKGLLWRALFLLWDPSIYSVRAPAVLLGGAALLLFYLWARQFYSQGTALAALALAATDPTYIFTARLDWGPVVLAHLLACGGLLLGSCWLGAKPAPTAIATKGVSLDVAGQRPALMLAPRLGCLAGAGFCFGLGLWDKATFVWFLAALAAALVLLFPGQVRDRLRPAPACVFLLAFLLGALPLIIYNVRSSHSNTGEAVRLEELDRGILEKKLSNLRLTLDGRFVYFLTGGWAMEENVAYSTSDGPQLFLDGLARLGPSRGTLLPWALAGALLVAAVAAGGRRPILFPLLVSALMWAQMLPLQNAGGSAHHYALAYPLPHLAVAAAGAWLWPRTRRWGRRVLVLALSALLLVQVGWDARHLRSFRQTGGLGNWTDAVYELAAYLNATRPDLVVHMDWGFTYPLLLLTQARVPQDDFYAGPAFGNPQDESPYVRQLQALLTRPNTVFLFHTEGNENFPVVRKVFERALAVSGMRARAVRTFHQRTGDPVATLVAAEADPDDAGATYGEPVQLSLRPSEVVPGGQYTIACPDLAGQVIDLKYLQGDRPAQVARRFCLLDSAGRATVRVPTPFPPATIEVVGVRVAGTLQWRPASATITVK